MMNIKFRLSDNHSFAVEFTAANVIEFRIALTAALSAYYKARQQPPELHVCTDIRQDWIPSNYPDSNAPMLVKNFPDSKISEDYWVKSVKSLLAGNFFDERLADVLLCSAGGNNLIGTNSSIIVIDGGKK